VLVLVNNAGVRADDLALSLTDDDWERVLDTQPHRCLPPDQRASRDDPRASSRVINVASVSGPAPTRQANYAAAKAGLIGMTKTIAVEVGPPRRHRQRHRSRADRHRHDRRLALSRMSRYAEEGRELPALCPPAAPARRRRRRCASSSPPSGAGYVTGSTLYVDGGLAA